MNNLPNSINIYPKQIKKNIAPQFGIINMPHNRARTLYLWLRGTQR
jgi:hypothetical protein